MKALIVSQIIFFFITALAQSDNHSVSGRIAPNFKLENFDREIIELNDLIGSGPILLCFWSSCCKSAVMQIEAFSGLYDDYKNEGFIMLAIATDDEKSVAKVKSYAKSKDYEFQVLYDTNKDVVRVY
jgi:peroxiredoxin